MFRCPLFWIFFEIYQVPHAGGDGEGFLSCPFCLRSKALRDLVPFIQFKKRETATATLLKLTLLHGCFSRFLNCTNGTKSCNAPQFVNITLLHWDKKSKKDWYELSSITILLRFLIIELVVVWSTLNRYQWDSITLPLPHSALIV